MWRNPLEAGQKFNKARSGELSWEEVGRNPLEAGQKFNRRVRIRLNCRYLYTRFAENQAKNRKK